MIWRITIIFLISCMLLSCVDSLDGKLDPIDVIGLNNHLADCINLENKHTQLVGQTTVLYMAGKLTKKTGSCGCTSMLISYRVLETISVDSHEATFERAFGLLMSPSAIGDEKTFEVVLKSDPNISFAGKPTVEISCKPPD